MSTSASDSTNKPPCDWVDQALPRALAFARTLLNDWNDAEDVVHDCVCRLLSKAERYDLEKDGSRLLIRSVANAAIDLHRRKEKSVVQLFEGLEEHGDSIRSLQPLDHLAVKEMADAVQQALQRLPVNQRAAMEMCSLGCTMAEISEALKVTEGNAAVLVHRARGSLAQLLKPFLGANV
jgi:RNA polymerase sigma-70 factor (ECF subfamily)